MELEPAVVSFHFGLPAKDLLDRVKATGAKILSSATTVDEARWLEDNGCDAIIAQGLEAGGHRGMFLSRDIATQAGTMALVPQVVDAVKLPVIAAGGIGDSRGIAAAFALGASAVQMGTAFLLCPEARTATLHRQALRTARDNQTVITNVFSGRPARAIVNRATRELGPLAEAPPAFPLAGNALAPLRAKAESLESDDFTPLWAGQTAGLARGLPAGRLTRLLAEETLAKPSGRAKALFDRRREKFRRDLEIEIDLRLAMLEGAAGPGARHRIPEAAIGHEELAGVGEFAIHRQAGLRGVARQRRRQHPAGPPARDPRCSLGEEPAIKCRGLGPEAAEDDLLDLRMAR